MINDFIPKFTRSDSEVIETYHGSFSNWQPHGYGICQFHEGPMKIYKGQWRDGQPHGEGEATYRDGTIIIGSFRHGEPEGLITTLAPGKEKVTEVYVKQDDVSRNQTISVLLLVLL